MGFGNAVITRGACTCGKCKKGIHHPWWCRQRGAGENTVVALGASVAVAGVIGKDASGRQLIDILESEGVKTGTIVEDGSRATTVKTRVLVGSHQLVRVDREVTDAISAELEEVLIAGIVANIDSADIVLLSDYNKGLFAPGLTQRIIKIAKEHQKKEYDY